MLLAIFCLCVSVAFSAAATPTSQSTAVSPNVLNSTYDKILSGTNTTEYTATTWGAVSSTADYVTFGPGSDNTTAYVYGLVLSNSWVTSVIRRTINATIAGNSSDTTEAAVIGDLSIAATINITSISFTTKTAVGPGYLAILTFYSSGTNSYQIKVVIISPNGTLTTTMLTLNGNYLVGDIFYERGSGVFFVTYYLASYSSPTTYSLYVQGVTASTAAVYWTSALSIPLVSTANSLSNFQIGPDNYNNASNIYVAFKDQTAEKTYYSKTAISSSTTSAGAATLLVADVSSGATYVPIGVWASNLTYGIAVSVESASGTYSILNFLNGSASTTADSGLTNITTGNGPTSVIGWGLNTGYTLVAEWPQTTGVTYVYGTFYANGTTNMTATTLASSLQGPLNTYEDANGAEWIGWSDIDTTNSVIYNLYLAKLQGQLNPAASNMASTALKTFMAFVALCLAAVFAL